MNSMNRGAVRQEKRRLREEALSRRESLPEEYRGLSSAQIFDKVCALAAYQEADVVLCYMSFGSEVETGIFISQALEDGKKVYVPRVLSREKGLMRFYLYEPDKLERSRWGIEEPPEDPSKIFPEAGFSVNSAGRECCLVILPGTAFDPQGGRLGYNGGFYDRFLARNPGLIPNTCGVAFDTQIVPEVPRDPYDVRAAVVVTENRIMKREDH